MATLVGEQMRIRIVASSSIWLRGGTASRTAPPAPAPAAPPPPAPPRPPPAPPRGGRGGRGRRGARRGAGRRQPRAQPHRVGGHAGDELVDLGRERAGGGRERREADIAHRP